MKTASQFFIQSPKTRAVLILLLSIVSTSLVWYSTLSFTRTHAEAQFNIKAIGIRDIVEGQFLIHEQMLKGAKGLFLASISVEAGEWSDYVTGLALQQEYPAFLSLGSATLSESTKPSLRVRYLEPPLPGRDFSRYDFYADALLNAPLMSAFKEGKMTTLSVSHLFEGSSDVFGLFLPIKKKGGEAGMVFAFIKLSSLVQEAQNFTPQGLDMQFTPVETYRPISTAVEETNGSGMLTRTEIILLGGRPWKISFSAPVALFSEKYSGTFATVFGLVVSILVCLLALSMGNLHSRSVALANRMTEELKIKEEQSRLILDTAFDAFVQMDDQGTITEWNRQAQRILGWQKKDVLDKSFFSFLSPEVVEEYRETLSRFVKTGISRLLNRRMTLSVLHRDGMVLPVEMTLWPIKTPTGVCFNAFIHDVREQKRAAQDIQEKMEQLAALNRIMLGREERIVELKDELEKLKKEYEKTTSSS